MCVRACMCVSQHIKIYGYHLPLQSESMFQLLSPLVQDQPDEPKEPVSFSESQPPRNIFLSPPPLSSLIQKTSVRSSGWWLRWYTCWRLKLQINNMWWALFKCHCKCLVTFNACTIVIIISNHSSIDKCVVYIYAYVYYILDSGHGICEKRSYECIQLCNLE